MVLATMEIGACQVLDFSQTDQAKILVGEVPYREIPAPPAPLPSTAATFDDITSVVVAPDGISLFVGNKNGKIDRHIVGARAQVGGAMNSGDVEEQASDVHRGPIYAVAWRDPAATTLATACGDGCLRLWERDTQGSYVLQALPEHVSNPLSLDSIAPSNRAMYGFANFAKTDGDAEQFFFVGSAPDAWLWKVDPAASTPSKFASTQSSNYFTSVSATKDWVALGVNGTPGVLVGRHSGGAPVPLVGSPSWNRARQNDPFAVFAVAFDPTGKLLAAVDAKGKVQIWRLDNARWISLADARLEPIGQTTGRDRSAGASGLRDREM
jgi:WD40 repeat protein